VIALTAFFVLAFGPIAYWVNGETWLTRPRRKRLGKTDDETLGEQLACAAASGDGRAIKLLEVEVGDIRMQPRTSPMSPG